MQTKPKKKPPHLKPGISNTKAMCLLNEILPVLEQIEQNRTDRYSSDTEGAYRLAYIIGDVREVLKANSAHAPQKSKLNNLEIYDN